LGAILLLWFEMFLHIVYMFGFSFLEAK